MDSVLALNHRTGMGAAATLPRRAPVVFPSPLVNALFGAREGAHQGRGFRAQSHPKAQYRQSRDFMGFLTVSGPPFAPVTSHVTTQSYPTAEVRSVLCTNQTESKRDWCDSPMTTTAARRWTGETGSRHADEESRHADEWRERILS